MEKKQKENLTEYQNQNVISINKQKLININYFNEGLSLPYSLFVYLVLDFITKLLCLWVRMP
jgi:hypothetical protein